MRTFTALILAVSLATPALAQSDAPLAPRDPVVAANPSPANVKVRLVEHLIGTDAAAPDGRKVGAVENILVKPDGTVAGLVLEWGGVAGIGERRVALPWNEAKLTTGAKQVVVDADRNKLESMPQYDTDTPAASGIDPDVKPLR